MIRLWSKTFHPRRMIDYGESVGVEAVTAAGDEVTLVFRARSRHTLKAFCDTYSGRVLPAEVLVKPDEDGNLVGIILRAGEFSGADWPTSHQRKREQ